MIVSISRKSGDVPRVVSDWQPLNLCKYLGKDMLGILLETRKRFGFVCRRK